MRRREFVASLGGAALGWTLSARAQPVAAPLVGFLNPRTPEKGEVVAHAFREGLRDEGFVEGRNVAVEYRWAHDDYGRLRALAAELVERRVSVIVAGGGAWVGALAATKTIPIVFTSGLDPLRTGMVKSLSRPEANLTGATFYSGVLVAKQLELLREFLPNLTSVAMLIHPSSPSAAPQRDDAAAAARANGLALRIVEVPEVADLGAAFASLGQLGVGALMHAVDPFFDSRPKELVDLSLRHGVPAIYYIREFVEVGGLVSYGGSIKGTYRQAGVYAGRILKGATPAELPVVQPTRLDLVVNMGTARTLDLSVPQSILARADEVIE